MTGTGSPLDDDRLRQDAGFDPPCPVRRTTAAWTAPSSRRPSGIILDSSPRRSITGARGVPGPASSPSTTNATTRSPGSPARTATAASPLPRSGRGTRLARRSRSPDRRNRLPAPACPTARSLYGNGRGNGRVGTIRRRARTGSRSRATGARPRRRRGAPPSRRPGRSASPDRARGRRRRRRAPRATPRSAGAPRGRPPAARGSRATRTPRSRRRPRPSSDAVDAPVNAVFVPVVARRERPAVVPRGVLAGVEVVRAVLAAVLLRRGVG